MLIIDRQRLRSKNASVGAELSVKSSLVDGGCRVATNGPLFWRQLNNTSLPVDRHCRWQARLAALTGTFYFRRQGLSIGYVPSQQGSSAFKSVQLRSSMGMKMFWLFHRLMSACLMMLSVMLLGRVAWAQGTEDWKLCRGKDANRGVAACARLINSPYLSNKERAEAHVELGLFLDEDTKRALEEFDKAIGLEPGYDRAYFQRGLAHLALRDFDKAISDLTKAIELSPSTAEIYHRRAYAFHQKKDLARALADFDRSIDIHPTMWAYIERADVHVDKAAFQLAVADYRKATDLVSPGTAESEKPLVEIVKRLTKIGRIDDATYAIAKITDHDTMMMLRVLRAYEPLWSNASAVAAMASKLRQERSVKVAETAVANSPRSMNKKWRLVSALSEADRHADAERIGLEALEARDAHTDAATQEHWLRAELAKALLKRQFERAQTVMEPVLGALNVPGKGDFDYVSTALNYSVSLYNAGRFREASETAQLAEGQVSSYGASVMNIVQACSAAALGNKAKAASLAAEMAKTLGENGGEIRHTVLALVCAGQQAEAAAIFLKGIKQNPEYLIHYAQCERKPEAVPFLQNQERDLSQMLEQPALRKAIEPIGRVRGC